MRLHATCQGDLLKNVANIFCGFLQRYNKGVVALMRVGDLIMLGDRLTQLRKAKKMTQQQIADKLHISRGTYAQYEIDRRIPEYTTLENMANYFDVSIDYLVGRTDDKKIKKKDPAEQLIEYLEFELTDEEIISRMPFKVDTITLTDDEVREFIAFVRAKRSMKKQQPASASRAEEL
jgi:transcriptional regulator with XRE-family HTH domain